MATIDLRPTFFAYGYQPALRAEAMREVIASVNGRGGSATGWEELKIDGQMLIESITARIDECSALIAEVSTMNSNVLFELGYAVASNKPTWLAFDESDTAAEQSWNEVALFSTVGRTDYGGDSERLVNRILASPPSESVPLYESLLAGAKPRESNAVFAPALPIRITSATHLESYLERRGDLRILGSSEDLLIAPLKFYTGEIYRSSAVIIHLLGESRRRASEHNARASFLAGFAHGLRLPVLMVVQKGYSSPLDFRDLLFQYGTTSQLIEKVKEWLETVPRDEKSGRRLGRMQLDVELPIRSFGQYVAEYEVDELSEYFVPTSEFAAVVSGDAQVFAGRKGTGKTATMSQAARELSLDRNVLVVPVKPSSYELSSLVALLDNFDSTPHAEYFLMTVWSYLIESEIAIQILRDSEGRSQSPGEQQAVEDLRSLLQRMEISVEGDLSARLERVVEQALSRLGSAAKDLNEVAKFVRSDHLARLRELTTRLLTGYSRIAVLIDNLDKNWERGDDLENTSRFILALLVAAGKIQKEFARTKRGEPILATLALFIRTDILDAVRVHAREPDKIGARTVDWDDDELLARVLEDRYAVNRSGSRNTGSMWSELFSPEVRGVPTREYLLWRVLRRPRDFVYFANSALTTAINRRHSVIDSTDIVYAERAYSRFAVEALIVESESLEVDLEEVLYEFAGVSATLDASEVEAILASGESDSSIRDWLISSSFLGIELSEGRFEYVQGATAARRKLRVAERHSATDGRSLRFRVHPAFRSYLEIVDDDLHE